MANEFFDLLKRDHAEARHLMEDILSKPQDQRKGPFMELSQAVHLHMQLEEKYFYPKLEGHKVLKPAQRDALRDHEEARELFQQLGSADIQNPEWEHQFRLLEQGLLKHMEMEEGYVFEKADDIISYEQFGEMARKCWEEKKASKTQH